MPKTLSEHDLDNTKLFFVLTNTEDGLTNVVDLQVYYCLVIIFLFGHTESSASGHLKETRKLQLSSFGFIAIIY